MAAYNSKGSHSANRVVALYSDGLLAFELPRDATLEELAERLAYLGEHLHGSPLTVAVQTAA
jgi:hypothetical protein